MSRYKRVVRYFAKPGPENTDEVVKAVIKRIVSNGIKRVIVASTSGKTGLKFAEALRRKASLIVVSHESVDSELKEKIVKLGGIVVDNTHLPLHARGMDKVRDSFYTLGQGFKVAVEVVLIAADKNLVKRYEDVIGVGGSGEGADTAIVARATPTREIFNRNKSKRLEVREILAMPLKKKWWD
jgi:hypothetical protein